MNKQPQISVLMCVYNSEKYLAAAVNSVLNQTFSDFEFIIIDDGSTDQSKSILRQFEKQDSRIQLFSRPNTGVISARNEALRYAKGRYVSVIDSDDIALPEMLVKQLRFLNSHPEYVAVGQRVLMIDPDDAPIRIANKLVNHEDIDNEHMQGQATFPHSGAMIRLNAIQTVGGYREELKSAEDMDLWLRLAEIGKLTNLPEVLLKYRLHLESIGHSKRKEQVQATRQLIIDAHHRRGLTPPKTPYPHDDDQASISNTHCRWAWWALMDGNVATARRHAILAVRLDPMSQYAWKTLFCATRGW
jgi:glycosyltransferase involved in cell wall biosynthesis